MTLFAHLPWSAFVGPFAQRCVILRNHHKCHFRAFLIHFDVTRVFSMPKLGKMHQNANFRGGPIRGLNRGPFARQSGVLSICPRGPCQFWSFRTSSGHRPSTMTLNPQYPVSSHRTIISIGTCVIFVLGAGGV